MPKTTNTIMPKKKWKTPTTRNNFYQRYMESMKGGKITKVGVNADGFPFFEVKMPGGITLLCEVSQDEEGNGPGFIFGLENPYEVERMERESATPEEIE
jgi:hypothetical protein